MAYVRPEDQWGEVRALCQEERWADAMVEAALYLDETRVPRAMAYIEGQMLHARAKASSGWSVVGASMNPLDWRVYYNGKEVRGVSKIELCATPAGVPELTLTVLPETFVAGGVPEPTILTWEPPNEVDDG